jgi:hypothetical protein
MKNIDELTTEELANLTDTEIEKCKTIICAKKGIKIVNKPIQPTGEHVNYDKQAYRIPGIEYIVFEDIKDAKGVANIILNSRSLAHTSYCNGSSLIEKGPSKNYNGLPHTFTPEIIEGYSNKELADKEAALSKKHSDALTKYYAAQKEYTAYVDLRNEAVKDFVAKQKAAKEKYTHQEDLINIYINTYLPLAENNDKVAMNFLKQAYDVTEEDEKVIMERVNKYNKTNNK